MNRNLEYRPNYAVYDLPTFLQQRPSWAYVVQKRKIIQIEHNFVPQSDINILCHKKVSPVYTASYFFKKIHNQCISNIIRRKNYTFMECN